MAVKSVQHDERLLELKAMRQTTRNDAIAKYKSLAVYVAQNVEAARLRTRITRNHSNIRQLAGTVAVMHHQQAAFLVLTKHPEVGALKSPMNEEPVAMSAAGSSLEIAQSILGMNGRSIDLHPDIAKLVWRRFERIDENQGTSNGMIWHHYLSVVEVAEMVVRTEVIFKAETELAAAVIAARRAHKTQGGIVEGRRIKRP